MPEEQERPLIPSGRGGSLGPGESAVREDYSSDEEIRSTVLDKGSIHIYLTAPVQYCKNSEVTVSYSSGGNPDLCTCGDKNTCTAGPNRKPRCTASGNTQAASSAATARTLPPEPVISPKGGGETTPSGCQVPLPPPVNGTESKPVVSTTSEKVKKQEEKRKSTSDNETTTSTSTTEATTGVKKETDSEKKPTGVTPASSVQKRKKSIQKRKYSESSQSLGESEGNNTEEDEEDKAGGKVSTRRSSTSVSKTPGKKEPATSSTTTPTNTPTKLSREERKLEAIMKAFERMEKSANRQKESRVRKDSTTNEKQEDSTAPAAAVVKNKPQPAQAAKTKRIVRKRKGRSKSFSISSSSARSRRAATRGTQGQKEEESSSGGEEDEEQESSDNSLPLNSVQTPPPSFKLPFSKKGPEDSNQDPESPEKPAGGCAKKRWLRQAISEECESPRSDSPTPLGESAGPLKKRRLARCSLSSDDKNFTPPTTPVPDDDTSTPPLDTAPTLTPKTAYACLVSVLSQFSS
ncbi:mucin-5AC-like [Diaphorina citri]|uniref:Mucin-5AC-like n=1 Tax=Diaphorina citri TaxID=121845 RepID=A0A3Q0JGR3_DIACI|nr:mucin-5AC-like [Diaphorina citri]